jgi:hypothetical protein
MSTSPACPLARCRAAAMLLAALLLSHCAAPRRASGPAAGPGEGAPRRETAALRRALERAIAEPAARDSLRLAVECRRDEGFAGVRVFGNGVGIWNDERQFRLDPGQIGSLLRALQAADFLALDEIYGGPPKTPPKPAGGGAGMATMVTCRVELALDGRDKQVLQLEKGEQSPVLKRLAEDLLAACEAPARSGLAAASLRDGLEKIARGELAPEAWVVVLHRKPDAGAPAPGFLLRVLGSQISVQSYDPQAGYGETVVADLRPEEIRTLAAELAARDPAAWPSNLYAEDYTDLSFQVLNHKKSIQARQFAGMEPGTGAPHQQAFEEVFALLDRLHSTVVDQGEAPSRAGGPVG